MLGYPASLEDLRSWSGDIGSDITFFFSSGTAYCTGRGEIVESLPPLPAWEQTDALVFKPAEGLSTGAVFRALDLDGGLSPRAPQDLLSAFTEGGAAAAAQGGGLVNDLEAPAFECNPSLLNLKSAIKGALGPAAAGAMMSGSGTSVYAVAQGVGEDTAQAAADSVLAEHPGCQFFQCSFLNKRDTVEAWYE
jgi:4-diphosphocytidyl-2-C-methyl-D-erythritol kinase